MYVGLPDDIQTALTNFFFFRNGEYTIGSIYRSMIHDRIEI